MLPFQLDLLQICSFELLRMDRIWIRFATTRAFQKLANGGP